MNIEKHRFQGIMCKVFIVTLAFIIILAFLCFVFFYTYAISKAYVTNVLNTDKFYKGTVIYGEEVSGLTKEEAIQLVAEKLKKDQEKMNINITCEEHFVRINGLEFDYKYNLEKTVDAVYEYARSGSSIKRYFELINIKNMNESFKLAYTVTEESIEKVINKIINECDDKELEAHVEKFNPNEEENMFIYSPGKDGKKLNREEVKQQISLLAKNKESKDVTLKKYEYKNTSTIEDAKNRTKLIGEFKTTSTNSANSNKNMKLSMDAINGTILNSGETFSFNDIVGDSNDPKRGFLPGAAILNGSIVMAYGGGICQAATTVYGAAIRANMTVIERRNHRYKSSYVPYGQDAAIDYKNIDLKFRNDFPYPVYIKSSMKDKILECKIYGPKSDKYDKIEIHSWVTSKSASIKAETIRLYLKDNNVVEKVFLPSSLYKSNN